MEYLQYEMPAPEYNPEDPLSFKPYYKWNTFNTLIMVLGKTMEREF